MEKGGGERRGGVGIHPPFSHPYIPLPFQPVSGSSQKSGREVPVSPTESRSFQSLPPSLPPSLTHSLTNSLTHSLTQHNWSNPAQSIKTSTTGQNQHKWSNPALTPICLAAAAAAAAAAAGFCGAGKLSSRIRPCASPPPPLPARRIYIRVNIRVDDSDMYTSPTTRIFIRFPCRLGPLSESSNGSEIIRVNDSDIIRVAQPVAFSADAATHLFIRVTNIYPSRENLSE